MSLMGTQSQEAWTSTGRSLAGWHCRKLSGCSPSLRTTSGEDAEPSPQDHGRGWKAEIPQPGVTHRPAVSPSLGAF